MTKMTDFVQLSDNGVSYVTRDGEWVYKTQPKYLADNEFYALSTLEYTGYVPRYVKRASVSTIRMEYIKPEQVTDPKAFMEHYDLILNILRRHNLRHDDLTEYAVLVHANQPVIIDWAESRMLDDPRPSKRPEGDAYWLRKSMEKLCKAK